MQAANSAPEMSRSGAAVGDQATLLLPAFCSGSAPFRAEDYSFTAQFIYRKVEECFYCDIQWRGALELAQNSGMIIFKSKVKGHGLSSPSSSVRTNDNFWSNQDFSSQHSSWYKPWIKHIGPSNDEMEEDSIYQERMILKLFPMNRGRFQFGTTQYKAEDGFYATMVCRILFKHVGRNLLYGGARSVAYPPTALWFKVY